MANMYGAISFKEACPVGDHIILDCIANSIAGASASHFQPSEDPNDAEEPLIVGPINARDAVPYEGQLVVLLGVDGHVIAEGRFSHADEFPQETVLHLESGDECSDFWAPSLEGGA